MTTNPEWDLAGLTRIGSGSLDLPLPDYGWTRTRDVWLDDDRLVYGHDWANPNDTVLLQKHGTGLLDGFVRLADASPDNILAYARKWGTLGICRHDLPWTHSLSTQGATFLRPGSEDWSAERAQTVGFCSPRRLKEPWGLTKWEPINAWREYAQRARALLNLIAAAELERPPSREDIQTAFPTFQLAEWEWHGTQGIGLAQYVSGRCISDWLDISGVSLGLVWWEKSKPMLRLMEGGLFGAIGIALAMKAARSDGLAICSGCSTAYTPSRAPRSGQRNYCPDCRASGVPQRDATRAMRARRANKTG